MNYIQATAAGWDLVWADGQVQHFTALSFARDFLRRMGAAAIVLDKKGNRLF